MPTSYKIHPSIGIARLGNSPSEFYIAPETPAALPIECDAQGNPLLTSDGQQELRVTKFKDAEGRVKRQAARFQIWTYDEQNPEGRPLQIGDEIRGGGNQGVLVDIQWRVYLANKKATWYEFRQLDGEHGYGAKHPRRNADLVDAEARQRLIIDPGPRTVNCRDNRSARFDRHGSDVYAPTFPPPLQPKSIDTLGELKTDTTGRLLVLGGHGNSGTFKFDQFGQPRIEAYANNDGWFDDVSDGPVMARLVMYSKSVGRLRFIDVEYPAWVIVGYPAYVPEILDMVTLDEAIYDMSVRNFALRTDLYGEAGTFDAPQTVNAANKDELVFWQNGRLTWNLNYKPWFYRDIWPILARPDEFNYLTSVLGQSNYPHNQSARGNFSPQKISIPPMVDWPAVTECEEKCIKDHHKGALFIDQLAPALSLWAKQLQMDSRSEAKPRQSFDQLIAERFISTLKGALKDFAEKVCGKEPEKDFQKYLAAWRAVGTQPGHSEAKEALDGVVKRLVDDSRAKQSDEVRHAAFKAIVSEHLRAYYTGKMLEECRRKCVERNTHDPYGPQRQFLFDLLRQPGEENHFHLNDKASSRTHNLPLMPLLAGDNPISNTLPSKFLRLTDFQFFLLRQWSVGMFFNEKEEGWSNPDDWRPYAGWVNRTGHDLDRGVLSNALGGAFCPGGEVSWIIRNPAVYLEPYRIKADPDFYNFRQTAAQANSQSGGVPPSNYECYVGTALSQENDFARGLQPGDLTKYGALPWQADFNECTSQVIDITYQDWNQIDWKGDNDLLLKREQQAWETLWWPAHRPLQVWEVSGIKSDGTPNYVWLDWSRGVPQTGAGDLKMVTEWWRLGFVRRNPYLGTADIKPTETPPDTKYISMERTEHAKEES
jgi:hypothetical protein